MDTEMDELIKEAETLGRWFQQWQEEAYPKLKRACVVETLIQHKVNRRKVRRRVDWVMFKNAKTGRTDSLPYPMAEKMIKAGKGVIVKEFEKRYEDHWVEDPRPPALDDLARLNLGDPVTVNGELSPFFKKVEAVCGFSPPLTTNVAYQMLSKEELKDLKEGTDEKEREKKQAQDPDEKGAVPAKEKRAGRAPV